MSKEAEGKEVRHTPGPWYVFKSRKGNYFISAPSWVQFIKLYKNPRTNEGQEIVETNARLISAAPELLQACYDALLEVEGIHEVMLLNPANKGMKEATIIGTLRAAIAKATGGA